MPTEKTEGLGGLAQLARAPALQAGGHRFESDILHFNGCLDLGKSEPFLFTSRLQDH